MSDQNPSILSILNSVLLDMGRSEVNTLGATPEAKRVYSIMQDVYYELCTRNLWPHKTKHLQLSSAADSTKPTKLILPEEVVDLQYIRYNVAESGQPAEYRMLVHKYPEDFLQLTLSRDSTASNIVSVTAEDGATFFVYNDAAPRYWTSFDEDSVYLDSYVATEESTVQGTKTLAHVAVAPDWPVDADSAVPMPARYVPMYKSMVKAVCFEKIKQVEAVHDTLWSRAAYARFLHDGSRTDQERPRKPRYGKKGGTNYGDSGFTIPRK